MGILQVLRSEFRKFRFLEILNFHPWVCKLNEQDYEILVLFAYASRKGSGETALLCSLTRAFSAHTHKKMCVDEGSGPRGTCIKRLIWPPFEPKTENCFSQISFDW